MASRLRSSLGRALRPFSMASRLGSSPGQRSGHLAYPQDWGAVWDSTQAIQNGLETEKQSRTALRSFSMASRLGCSLG
uniref:Uncharacterized protein n=1 Tax=Bracon brevicornis TaxID=1563983 RepID=A0A6V7LD91_9HYME